MKKRYNVMLDESLHKDLKRIAKKEERPLSNLLNVVLKQFAMSYKKKTVKK